MDKEQYNKEKELILKAFGKPDYDMGSPVNEAAVKLVELRNLYAKSRAEITKTKKLAEGVKELKEFRGIDATIVPDELVRAEWLISFTDLQKTIVRQWLTNIKQTPESIAETLKTTKAAVTTTLSLEAFKMLRGHLALAYKELLPLEASAALRDCLSSPTENVRFNAIKLILIDAGLYRDDKSTDSEPKDKVLDAETERRLKALGDKVLGL